MLNHLIPFTYKILPVQEENICSVWYNRVDNSIKQGGAVEPSIWEVIIVDLETAMFVIALVTLIVLLIDKIKK